MSPTGLLREGVAVTEITGIESGAWIVVLHPDAANLSLPLHHCVRNAQARQMPRRDQSRHTRTNDHDLKIRRQAQPIRPAFSHRRCHAQLVQEQICH